QLAALLQRRGVVPNQLVAVVMERGWEQVVATLAIQYTDYAVWQRRWLSGERLQYQAAYWR
ncbi:hypothetical protein, partial [Pseudomonas syringae]|uniref:hypothetical protein n=1 Tax=Pseudomonas syringae TaxID=317 RepID=UPI0038F74F4A